MSGVDLRQVRHTTSLDEGLDITRVRCRNHGSRAVGRKGGRKTGCRETSERRSDAGGEWEDGRWAAADGDREGGASCAGESRRNAAAGEYGFRWAECERGEKGPSEGFPAEGYGRHQLREGETRLRGGRTGIRRDGLRNDVKEMGGGDFAADRLFPPRKTGKKGVTKRGSADDVKRAADVTPLNANGCDRN
jgi:hypothetical protein